MSVVGEHSIFLAMKQNGPFRIDNDIDIGRLCSLQSRQWVQQYFREPVTRTKYRAVREHVFDLLQVSSYREITELIRNPAGLGLRHERATALLANLFGLSGEYSEIQAQMKDYALSADSVIAYLKARVFSGFKSHIEISNEIETTHNPLDLLLIIFDNRYHKKIRFEAKRKLVLMGLAGSIDQRERETDIETKFSGFLQFLNNFVWSPQQKIGELTTAYLLSEHDPLDYSCTRVEVIENLSLEEQEKLEPSQKLLLVKRRMFHYLQRDIPVYVTVRKKDAAAKILKLLRKNEKNPAVAVDDELGLMAVLDSTADVKRFVKHLKDAALKTESIMVIEDINDTLTGGEYQGNSVGSSGKTPMLKFFAKLGGMRVEFIIHTNQTYLNYRYQRDIAHEEYEVKRLFDSGVAEFLFPEDIYHLDMQKLRSKQLSACRKEIENR